MTQTTNDPTTSSSQPVLITITIHIDYTPTNAFNADFTHIAIDQLDLYPADLDNSHSTNQLTPRQSLAIENHLNYLAELASSKTIKDKAYAYFRGLTYWTDEPSNNAGIVIPCNDLAETIQLTPLAQSIASILTAHYPSAKVYITLEGKIRSILSNIKYVDDPTEYNRWIDADIIAEAEAEREDEIQRMIDDSRDEAERES